MQEVLEPSGTVEVEFEVSGPAPPCGTNQECEEWVRCQKAAGRIMMRSKLLSPAR